MSNTTLQDILEPLANQLATIQNQISHLQGEETHLKEQIRKLVPGIDTYAAGGLTVVVAVNKRFDQKLAAKAIPAHLIPLVSETTSVVVYDKTKISVLCPTEYDACFSVFDTKVSLR